MKSKVFAIFTIVCLTTLFSACSEEEIGPNDDLNHNETVSDGVAKDDKGF